MIGNKPILDACCGSRMFWFDKNNLNCLFVDIRSETIYAKDTPQVGKVKQFGCAL